MEYHKAHSDSFNNGHGNRHDFLIRLKKNLVLESKKTLRLLRLWNASISTLFRGGLEFLLLFSSTRSFLGVVMPVLMTFLIARYMTLLTPFFVYFLTALALGVAFGKISRILFMCMVYAFFTIFMI